MTQASPGISVLLVDDDELVRRALGRTLASGGFAVDLASDGREALSFVASRSYDVILTDINMPGIDGMAMLRAVRRHDMDVPIILITGDPGLDTALQAIEHGAFHYLAKPVEPAKLLEVVRRAARMHGLAKLKRQALDIVGADARLQGDRAGLEARFERAMERMWLAYQPIVSWSERRVIAYEALLRSDEPTLATPLEILKVAERIGRISEVGHAVRQRLADDMKPLSADVNLFVNLHPSDLSEEDLVDGSSPLVPHARRLVLEITERAALDEVKGLPDIARALRDFGFRLAIDDLGAGYAGLTTLTLIEPEVVKLDMALIRDVDTNATKAQLIRSMIKLCSELGMMVISEGVETPGERDALVSIGGNLFQGYLFARPGRGFPEPKL